MFGSMVDNFNLASYLCLNVYACRATMLAIKIVTDLALEGNFRECTLLRHMPLGMVIRASHSDFETQTKNVAKNPKQGH